MIDGADALRNERRQQLSLFFVAHRPMNPRREDDGNVGGQDSELNQTPNEQIDNLGAARGARRIGRDN